MPASYQTVSAALINNRTDKVIHNLLQTDVAAWARIPVKKRTWSGDVCIIVCRTARNGSVVSTVDTHEPVAGNQGLLRLTVQSKQVVSKLQVDVFTMVSADDSQGSQAVEPADEMNGLLDDIAKTMTRFAFLGGGGLQGVDSLAAVGSPIGLVWQRSNAITTYGYRGRFDDIAAAANGNPAINFARFIRLDTYATVGADTLITGLTPRTITLAANIDTSAIPVGVPCAVLLVGAQSQAFTVRYITGTNTPNDPVLIQPAPGQGITEVGMLVGDMTGFISNLTQPLHFGQNRANATDVKIRRLRSNFRVCNNTNAQGGDVLTSSEFGRGRSLVKSRSGGKLDAWWMSWDTQLAYPQSLVGTADGNVRTPAGGAPKRMDPVPGSPGEGDFDSGFSYGGTPVLCSELCPDGTAIGMSYDGWERLFKGPQEGVWVGATGINKDPLMKLPGETQYSATRMMFPEQVCLKPLAQVVITGIADP